MKKNHPGNNYYKTKSSEQLLKDSVLSLCRFYFNNNDINENVNLFNSLPDRNSVNDFISFLNGKINTSISLPRQRKELSVNGIVDLIENELMGILIRDRKFKIKPVFKDRYNLSYAQRRFWVLYKLQPLSAFCNIGFVHKITGPLNLDIFKETLRALVSRHDSLRANFRQEEDGPVQVVAAKLGLNKILQVFDLKQTGSGDELKKRIELIIKKQTQTSFKLETDSLLKVVLIKIGNGQHFFSVVMHHIISDARSFDIFYREFSSMYNSRLNGIEPELPPVPIQFKDYAEWERSEENKNRINKQEKYWLGKLCGDVPVFSIPEDKPRPPVQAYVGGSESIVLDKKITQDIQVFSRETDSTVFAVLLSIFKVFLFRITGQTNIIVGTPVTNRDLKETQDVIGVFLNNLSLRTDLSGDPVFIDLLKQVKGTVMGAIDNKDIPFEYLFNKLKLERDMSRSPIWNTMFQYDDHKLDQVLSLSGLKLKPYSPYNQTAKFDLKLRTILWDGQMSICAEYNADLFLSGTIKKFLACYKNLLQGALKTPRQKISALEIMTPEEKEKLIYGFNNTKVDYPKNKTLPELFEKQVKRTPDNIAIEYEGQKLTYRALNEKANQLARFLMLLGVKKESAVGILLIHSIELFIAEIAILKAGGTCLIINPDFPAERIRGMLTDAQAKIIVTADEEKIKFTDRRIKAGLMVVNLSNQNTGVKIRQQRKDNPKKIINVDNLAYLVYTSGSTGKPKIGMVKHRGIINHVYHRINAFNVTGRDRLCANMSAGFIVFPLHTFVPLLTGAKLIIFSNLVWGNFQRMFQELDAKKINVLEVPTSSLLSYLEYIKEYPDKKFPLNDLRIIFIAGEKLRQPLNRRLVEEYKHLELYSAYGQTECSGMTLYRRAYPGNSDNETEGLPTQNHQVYILDQNRNLLPLGIPGELYISGDGLARGYFNDPEKTKEVFLPHPFLKGQRIYKTGDLAKMHEDGNVEILGRLDHQVKIRGYRIEPGEIEMCIKKINNIKECVVIKHEEALVAYYTTDSKTTSREVIKIHLESFLPDYMVPTFFVRLSEFPLNQNGKLDRKNLPAPKEDNLFKKKFKTPRRATEKRLVKIWREILGVETIGLNDDFFDLGGDSLKIVRLHHGLKKIYGDRISVALLFALSTIRKLSDFLNQKEGIKKQIIRDKQKNEKRIIKNFKNYQQINQKILKLVKNS